MKARKAVRFLVVRALMLLPGTLIAGGKYDGNWTMRLACEAHGQMPGYKWEFPSVIKDGNFHGQHGDRRQDNG